MKNYQIKKGRKVGRLKEKNGSVPNGRNDAKTNLPFSVEPLSRN